LLLDWGTVPGLVVTFFFFLFDQQSRDPPT